MSFANTFDGNTTVVLDMELHIDEVFIAYSTHLSVLLLLFLLNFESYFTYCNFFKGDPNILGFSFFQSFQIHMSASHTLIPNKFYIVAF